MNGTLGEGCRSLNTGGSAPSFTPAAYRNPYRRAMLSLPVGKVVRMVSDLAHQPQITGPAGGTL